MSSTQSISFTCPSCGGAIAVVHDSDHFKCRHCGHEYRIQHDIGSLVFIPVIEATQNDQATPDHGAAELEIDQLKRELINMQIRLHDTRLTPDADFVPRSRTELLTLTIGIVALVLFVLFMFASIGGHIPSDLVWIVLMCMPVAVVSAFVGVSLRGSRYKIGRTKRDDEMETLIAQITLQRLELDSILGGIDR